MKVIAKKVLYEQDLYQYPDENVNYGLFSLDETTNAAPRRKGPVLVHRKGEIREWTFEIKKYCCEEMEKIPGEVILFKTLGVFSGSKMKIGTPSCYIRCSCWGSQEFYKIKYCLFCGKKIEIEEKK